MNDDSEFFIGWQGKAPPETGRRLVRITVLAGLLAVIVAATLAALQGTIGPAQWNYAHAQVFSGTLRAEPVPTLFAGAPEMCGTETFLLVQPNKFGFDPAIARQWAGLRVQLRATVLCRDGQAMLEVEPGSIRLVELTGLRAAIPEPIDLGEHALRGEIVDSKCFLGAMNPGVLKPHRACAIRCISGGVPPILLVRDAAGLPVCYLLIGPGGEAINRDVLDFVAEPVEIRGRVQRLGEQLVLRARPDAIQRLP